MGRDGISKAIARCGTLADVHDMCYVFGMADEPLIIVYQAVNKTNGNRYIGMTSRGLRYRKNTHKQQAKGGSDMVFSRAVRKYGFSSFEFTILEVCADVETALRRERELIAEHKPEYNVAVGGLRGPQGWKHSEESIAKMKAARAKQEPYWRGKKRSAESIAKRTATRSLNPPRPPWTGKKRSPETIAKIIATRPFLPPPKPPTPETLEIWLKNMKSANAKRMKAVKCLTDGVVYESIRAAAKAVGMKRDTIKLCCERPGRSTRGLQFEFVKGEPSE